MMIEFTLARIIPRDKLCRVVIGQWLATVLRAVNQACCFRLVPVVISKALTQWIGRAIRYQAQQLQHWENVHNTIDSYSPLPGHWV